MTFFLKWSKNKFAAALILLILIFLIFVLLKWHYYPTFDTEFSDEAIVQSIPDFKECMKNSGNKYKNETEIFFIEFKKCIKTFFPLKEKQFDKFDGKNGIAEIFLPLIDKKDGCKWLTIGIDNSLRVETNFKEKYPECAVFGADPYPPKNFSLIGKVFNFGVDLDNTFNTAIVSSSNGTNALKEIQVYSLPNLLINYINSKLIYYLKIDIEGYEYKILESLVGNERYANSGLTFCQISVNLHNPKMPLLHPAIKNMNMVDFILNFVQLSSPYIPIYNVPYSNFTHQKITFINVHSPECNEAFKICTMKKAKN